MNSDTPMICVDQIANQQEQIIKLERELTLSNDCIKGLESNLKACEDELAAKEKELEKMSNLIQTARENRELKRNLASLQKLAKELAEGVKELQTANMAKGLYILMGDNPNDKEAIACQAKMPSELEIKKWISRAHKNLREKADAYTNLPPEVRGE